MVFGKKIAHPFRKQNTHNLKAHGNYAARVGDFLCFLCEFSSSVECCIIYNAYGNMSIKTLNVTSEGWHT